jgi:hypothetical protein
LQEANPLLGFLGGGLFLLVGFALSLAPARIQSAFLRFAENKRRDPFYPLGGFVESQYVSGLRIMGVLALGIGLLMLIVSTLEIVAR